MTMDTDLTIMQPDGGTCRLVIPDEPTKPAVLRTRKAPTRRAKSRRSLPLAQVVEIRSAIQRHGVQALGPRAQFLTPELRKVFGL